MDFVLVLKEPKCNGMYRGISPPFIEEAPGPIEVVKVVLVGWRSEEGHVGDFEVGPKVASRIAVGPLVVLGSMIDILQPAKGVISIYIMLIVLDELLCLGPQARDTFGIIIKVDCEAICFVVLLHPCENVIVHVTEEVDIGFNPPVPLRVEQLWVLVEHARVPAAHLVV